MIGLIQRVSEASVTVDQAIVGEIKHGMLVLVGVEKDDDHSNIEKLTRKLLNYRIFSDDDGKMNLNVQQVGGEILLVSQFTLVADTAKGNRPGFSRGASPEQGEQIFNQLVAHTRAQGGKVATGQFGADMKVRLLNDGPVTFHFQV